MKYNESYTPRLLLLTVMIVMIAFAVAAATLYTLYTTALQQNRVRLTETVQSQARLIEAIAAFDKRHNQHNSSETSEVVLEQLRAAHASYIGLGETGEFTLATHNKDEITFLLSHRHATSGNLSPIPFQSDLAEPMRLALKGESTTLIGLDYRGETVLAATEPVKGVKWGLVAKIDLNEVRAPFIRSGFIALTLTSILSIAGVALFRRLTAPMITHLEESEARYHAVFDQAAVGIARVSTDGSWLEVNQKLCDIVGYSKSEMLGLTFQKITYSEDLHQDLYNIRELLSGQRQTYSLEKRYYKKSGELVWVNVTASLIRNDQESAQYFISVNEDISDRKVTEQMLAKRENFISRTLDASQTGIYIHNIHTQQTEFINSRYTAITGYRLSDIQTMSSKEFYNLIHPSDQKRFKEHTYILAQSREGEAIEIRYKFLRMDGEWIILQAWNSVFERDKGGNMLSYVSTFLDITEQEKDQQRLRQAAIVLANTIEGVIVTDAEGTITDINPAFSNITGYMRDEVIGENSRLLKSGLHDTDFYQGIWQLLKDKGYWHGEIWNRRKDGSNFPALQTINSVLRSDGTPSQYISIFSDITKIKQTEKELEFLAHHDPLTKLPNRILFNSYLEQSIKLSARQGKSLSVAFIDIDHFKEINDSLGHQAGDQLLKMVAERMKDSIRKQDIISRLSGDEFVVLLEEIEDENHAVVAVEKLMSVFTREFPIDSTSLRITSSIGICLYPQDADNAETLMRYADVAMYRAKEAGRNNYQFFTQEMNTSSQEHVLISDALSHAIFEEALSLDYQPQVNLETSQIVGIESLCRWKHATLGSMPPARFIPIAEQSGVIKEIGQFVLESSCQQGAKWLAQGVEFGRIAINVSGCQFQNETFTLDILNTLDKYDFPAKHLELEITESTLMRGAGGHIEVLQKLRDQGITIAIDDFGTGFSSLSYLSQLPVDKLKIDRSFVYNLLTEKSETSIIVSIIALGQALTMEVIAEGIETEAQMEFLKNAGCHYGQGYLHGRPLPAKELTEFLLNGKT